MQDMTTTATLVEPAEIAERGGVTALVSRAEIEEALETSDESFALWFDVERGDDSARLTVELTPAEAEELLRRSSGDDVMVALGASGIVDLFEDADVEAHGMREKIVLLGVVAATAAASTSVAQAKPIMDLGAGGGDTITLAGAAAASGLESPAQAQGGAGIAQSGSATVYSDAIDRAAAAKAAPVAPDAFERAVASQSDTAAVPTKPDAEHSVLAQGSVAPAPDAFERAVTSQAPTELGGAVAAAGDQSPAAATGGAAMGSEAAPYSDAIDRAAATGGAAAAATSAKPDAEHAILAQGTTAPAPDAFERAVVSQAGAEIGGAVAAAGDLSPAAATGGAGIGSSVGGAVAAAGTESPAQATGGAAPIPPPVTSEGSGIELQLPSPAEGALLGGLALLITGAGVVAARGSRRRPATP
jgi:hypothetical protein